MNYHHKEETMSDLHWGPSLSEVSHSQYLLIQDNRACGIVRTCLNCQYDCHCNVKGPGHQQVWSEYYDFIGIWRLMQVPITYAWAVYVQKPGTLKHCHKYMWNKKHWGEEHEKSAKKKLPILSLLAHHTDFLCYAKCSQLGSLQHIACL